MYLGAAPGVGKTYAMLDEARRRKGRGATVVVGPIETHGRPATEEQLQLLDARPTERGNELPIDEWLAVQPDLAVIDKLAKQNAATSVRSFRWQDAAVLLDAGIDVLATLNISEVESQSDVAARITGVPASGTVPDSFLRAFAEVDLVDMSPTALRRRLAHGNVFAPDEVDVRVAEQFSIETLTSLRELSLLWVAERLWMGTPSSTAVDSTGAVLAGPRDTRERVVVAISGSPGGDVVIRRAARIAQRARCQLVGVHVARATEDPENAAEVERQQQLVSRLGGVAHTVLGTDVVDTLLVFSRSVRGTQLVVGASGHGRLRQLLRGSIITELVRRSNDIDVQVVSCVERDESPDHVDRTSHGPPSKRRQSRFRPSPVPRRRLQIALLQMIVGLPFLTFFLERLDRHMSLASQMLLFLGLVVIVAATGGAEVGVTAMLCALAILNWFFTAPKHTLLVSRTEDVVALLVFGLVTVVVATLVSQARRRTEQARRSHHEAEVLVRSSATAIGTADPIGALVEQLRASLDLSYAGIEGQEMSGNGPSTTALRTVVDIGDDRALVLVGRSLSVDDRRLVTAFVNQLRVAMRNRDLESAASKARQLHEANDFRTALLRAVSHDLRTPLASVKAASSSLLSTEVRWDEAQQREFLETIDDSADSLTRLIDELLEMSRLESGVITANAIESDLTEITQRALTTLGAEARRRVQVVVKPAAQCLNTDPGLLERVIANLAANALHASRDSTSDIVRIEGERLPDAVVVRVVDQGIGIPRSQRAAARLPFQRVDDASSRSGLGLGLGLAIADGLTRTLGGTLDLDDTPGGGLTVTIRLPQSTVASQLRGLRSQPESPVDDAHESSDD